VRASHSPVPPLVSSRPFRNKCSIPLSRLCHSCLVGGRALSVRSRAVVGVFAGFKVCIVFLQGHPVPPSFRSTSSVSFTGRLAWFSLGGFRVECLRAWKSQSTSAAALQISERLQMGLAGQAPTQTLNSPGRVGRPSVPGARAFCQVVLGRIEPIMTRKMLLTGIQALKQVGF
jgi:hypothetical protein